MCTNGRAVRPGRLCTSVERKKEKGTPGGGGGGSHPVTRCSLRERKVKFNKTKKKKKKKLVDRKIKRKDPVARIKGNFFVFVFCLFL